MCPSSVIWQSTGDMLDQKWFLPHVFVPVFVGSGWCHLSSSGSSVLDIHLCIHYSVHLTCLLCIIQQSTGDMLDQKQFLPHFVLSFFPLLAWVGWCHLLSSGRLVPFLYESFVASSSRREQSLHCCLVLCCFTYMECFLLHAWHCMIDQIIHPLTGCVSYILLLCVFWPLQAFLFQFHFQLWQII